MTRGATVTGIVAIHGGTSAANTLLDNVTGGTIAIGVANTGGITIGNGATIKTISIGTGNAVNTINIGTHASPANLITIGGALSTTKINNLVTTHTPAAINATATATAAEVKTGYITSTSAAATTITLPTGTLLGTALGATQGTIHHLYIDNTAGANTVTTSCK